jgi:hypothetical protein
VAVLNEPLWLLPSAMLALGVWLLLWLVWRVQRQQAIATRALVRIANTAWQILQRLEKRE